MLGCNPLATIKTLLSRTKFNRKRLTAPRKIAFIDSENFHQLDKIDLSCYETIYYFFGAKQHSIKFGEAHFSQPLNFVLIPIEKIAKNNLDFHLCYYLGKLDETLNKDIVFDVFAEDAGYCGIIDFINNNSRKCNKIYIKDGNVILNGTPINPSVKQVSSAQVKHNQIAPRNKATPTYQPSKEVLELCKFLNKRSMNNCPKKRGKLENLLLNSTKLTKANINKSIEELVKYEGLSINYNKISYHLEKFLKAYSS